MIKNRRSVLIIFILTSFFVLLSSGDIKPEVRNNRELYTVELFRSEDGWGYMIMKDGKVFIYQPYVPAVNGLKTFSDKRSAHAVGNLVIEKLRNKNIPAITRKEMADLGVEGI